MSLVDTDPKTASAGAAYEGELRDFLDLLKPRVMSLVIFTALVGLVMAPGEMHPVLSLISLLCIGIGAGASGALNMWYDADIDAQMGRTAERPIPAGKVTPDAALTLGGALSVFSVATLGIVSNWLAAGMLAFTIFFYAVVYTMWLKRWTPQNIVIGGAAGAFPPIIGWMAVTNSIAIEPIVLFAIIFFWTPPHFWALALLKKDDYARAGVPMLPVVAGERATRNQIVVYTVIMAVVGLLPTALGFAGLLYGGIALAMGTGFTWIAIKVRREQQGEAAKKAARELFAFSILYLFVLFSVLLVEAGMGVS